MCHFNLQPPPILNHSNHFLIWKRKFYSLCFFLFAQALTGASVAALTIYDMCKGVSHDMVIGIFRISLYSIFIFGLQYVQRGSPFTICKGLSHDLLIFPYLI